jgi:hypothetical protein
MRDTRLFKSSEHPVQYIYSRCHDIQTLLTNATKYVYKRVLQRVTEISVSFLDSNVTPYPERDGESQRQHQYGAGHSQPQFTAEWCNVGVPARFSEGPRAAHKYSYPVENGEIEIGRG